MCHVVSPYILKSVQLKHSNMKVLNIDIETEQFWINYCDFKATLQLPLPVDTFRYKCSCSKRFYLFKNGDLFLDDEPRMSIPDLLKIEKEKLYLGKLD